METSRLGYLRLVEVRFLHHYWLDDGATGFERIADPAKREHRLLGYDVRRLLAFTPAPATAATVAALRGVFRTHGLGFLLAVPDDARIPLEATFEFHVRVLGPGYAGYTSQPLSRPGITPDTTPSLGPQPVVEIEEAAADPVTGVRRTHRYKANVPVLSNLTGAAAGAGATDRLFLSRAYPAPAADDAMEALISDGTNVLQRQGDPPDAALTELGPLAELPVFLHQGDVPAITPPAGSTGAPAFGIELETTTPSDVAAVVRLVPRRPGDDRFDFAAADGAPRPRVFEVHLPNRRTTWRYFARKDGTPIATEPDPLPLTYFGNAGSRQKAAPDTVGAEFDTQDPRRILRLLSDIYV